MVQKPGQTVTFAIEVRNVGNNNATNVVIIEQYDQYLEFLFANPSPDAGFNNQWTFPVLSPNSKVNITIVLKVKDNAPLTIPPYIIHNTASVTCNELPQRTASADVAIKCPNFWDPAHVTQRKVVSPTGTVTPGTWLTYTNYYGNSGNAPATNVTIVDTLDTNLDETTLIIYNGGTYNPVSRTITWIIPVLHPGETGSVSFKVRVRSTIYGLTFIANTSYVKSDQTPELVATNTVVNPLVGALPCIPPGGTGPGGSTGPGGGTGPTPSSIDISFNEPDTICAQSFSKFILTFTGGSAPYEYTVDFGDGLIKASGKESGNFVSITHVYEKPGSYTVNIVVKDANKKESTLTKTVTVKDCTPVITVYHHNFMIGYPDNTIRPEREVSRAEIAAMLLRALGINASRLTNDIVPFNDIPITHWAYNFTRRAYQEGLMQGDSSGKFRPDDFATRAEVATILVRLRNILPDSSEPLFSDVKKTDWFAGYVNAAVKAGLISGYPDRTFKPNKTVTRAEFAAMFEKALFREDIPLLKNSIKHSENVIKFKDLSPSHWAYYIMLEAFQPHTVQNVSRGETNIGVKSKSIPVYLPNVNTTINITKVGDTITAIVPVDGIIDGKDPSERKVVVKIINKDTP